MLRRNFLGAAIGSVCSLPLLAERAVCYDQDRLNLDLLLEFNIIIHRRLGLSSIGFLVPLGHVDITNDPIIFRTRRQYYSEEILHSITGITLLNQHGRKIATQKLFIPRWQNPEMRHLITFGIAAPKDTSIFK